MRRVGAAAVVIALLVVRPSERLAAQDSQYQIQGLGTPGRWESVQARSTGGAFGPFDPLSQLTEAALVNLGRLTASAMGATYHRDVDLAGTTAALRDSRFPLMSLASRRHRLLDLSRQVVGRAPAGFCGGARRARAVHG